MVNFAKAWPSVASLWARHAIFLCRGGEIAQSSFENDCVTGPKERLRSRLGLDLIIGAVPVLVLVRFQFIGLPCTIPRSPTGLFVCLSDYVVT